MSIVYDLIRDPVFIDYVAADSAYAAHARQLVSGSASPSAEPAFQFNHDVLPSIADLADAGRSAQRAAEQCLNSADSQAAMCSILNRLQPDAIREMVGLGGTNLLQLFSEVRSLLAQEEGGKRLLLFIEDLTVLSGIEHDFADALTVPSTVQRPLCELRVLAASTDENYLASPFWTMKTVATRTAASGSAYILDQTWESFGDDELQRFLAHYLNAVRIGVDGLEVAWAAGASDDAWVPNACDDCPLRPECHDLFGNADGIGLYPLNPEALLRIRDLIGAEFDPRKLLSGTREVLGPENRRLLLSGDFPPANLDDTFRKHEIKAGQGLPIALATRIRQSYSPDQQRRVERLVEFWGRSTVSEALVGIAKAFGIDLEPLVQDGPPPPQTQPTPPDGPPPPVNRLQEAIEWWFQGKTLTSELATDIRQLVFGHLRTAVLAADALAASQVPEWIKGGGGQFLNLHSIVLEKAEGGGRDTAGEWSIRLQPTDLDDVRFLLGLVQYAQVGHWHFEGGADLYRLHRERIDIWTDGLVEMIHHGGQPGKAPLLDSICSNLVAGSAVLGLVRGPMAGANEQLAFVLADESTVGERSDSWGNPLQSMLSKPDPTGKRWDRKRLIDELLGRVGVRQGATGKFRAVDGTEIILALTGFPSRHLPEIPDDAPDGLRDYWKKVPSLVEENLDWDRSHVLREWRKHTEEITRILGNPDELPEILQAVDRLVIAGHEAGVLGGVDSRTSWEDQRSRGSDLHHSIAVAIDGLHSYSETSYWDKVLFLSNDYGPVLEAAAELANLCLKVTVSTRENLEHQADSGSHHIGVREDLQALVNQLEESLTDLENLT